MSTKKTSTDLDRSDTSFKSFTILHLKIYRFVSIVYFKYFKSCEKYICIDDKFMFFDNIICFFINFQDISQQWFQIMIHLLFKRPKQIKTLDILYRNLVFRMTFLFSKWLYIRHTFEFISLSIYRISDKLKIRTSIKQLSYNLSHSLSACGPEITLILHVHTRIHTSF